MVPFHFIMGFMLFFSTVMVVCSSSLLPMWVALEINTISFMPLMKSKGGAKYLLAQSVGSTMILSGCALNLEALVFLGAVMKAGIAPAHSWFPQVMEHLSWKMCLVLSTWQKVGPLVVLFSMVNLSLCFFFGCASLVFGSVGAMKQTRLRNILAYSSISHMGWCLSGFMISVSLGFLYFLVYCFTSFFIMLKLSKNNKVNSLSKDLTLIFIILSMSGLPPFVGLFPKMWIFFGSPSFISVFLVLSSIIMLLVYVSMMFSSVSTGPKSWSVSSVIFLLFGMVFML